MLADDAVLANIRYPVLVSPKLDGVRATFVAGSLRTRSLKPIPNRRVQELVGAVPLDGELIVGDPTSSSVFRDTMKVVMSHDEPIGELKFYVFDLVDTTKGFRDRLQSAHTYCDINDFRVPVPHIEVADERTLLALEEECLNNGFEGLMLRDPTGPYKLGRSTAREGYLLKLKRRKTSEAVIVGFVEQMHNANEAKIDNLGYMERSSHKENLIPMDTLGALIVRDMHTGVEFNVGTGFDALTRKQIWVDQPKYRAAIISYEYLPVGVKDKPRHPVFKGFRPEVDIGQGL